MPEVLIPQTAATEPLFDIPGKAIRQGGYVFSIHDLPLLAQQVNSAEIREKARRYEGWLRSQFNEALSVVPGELGEFQLWQHQKQAAAFCVMACKTIGGALLSMDMGTGKTGSAMAATMPLASFHNLVVAPASVKRNWAGELLRAGFTDPIIQTGGGEFYHAIKKDEQVTFKRLKDAELGEEFSFPIKGKIATARYPKEYEWLIVNYEMLPYLAHGIRSRGGAGSPWRRVVEVEWHMEKPDVVVLDESHFIKNTESIRSRAASMVLRDVRYKILLTGTPVLNRVEEAYPLLHLIDPQRFDSPTAFEKRYSTDKAIEELRARIKPIFFRRTQAQVLTDLPPLRRAFLDVPLDAKHALAYQQAEDDLVTWLQRLGQNERAASAARSEAFARIAYLRRIILSGRVKEELNFIENAVNCGVGKIVVFSTQLEGVHATQMRFGDRCVSYTGEIPERTRESARQTFWDDEDVNVFAATIQTGALGINLQCASVVFFLDLWWVPAIHSQCESRLHRAGQHHPVMAYYFHSSTPPTLDTEILDALRSKIELVGEIVGDKPLELSGGGVRWLLSSLLKRRQK